MKKKEQMIEKLTTKEDLHKFLEKEYGGNVAQVSHEIYFNGILYAGVVRLLKAFLGAIRDCYFLMGTSSKVNSCKQLVIVTEAGPSGYGSLRNIVREIRRSGESVVVLTDPRRKIRSRDEVSFVEVKGLGLTNIIDAFRSAKVSWYSSVKLIDYLCIVIFTFRGSLWRSVVEGVVRDCAPKVCWMHNDFDLLSSAVNDVVKRYNARTVCVQHGIPTQEFFPPRAEKYIVWGSRFEELFRCHGGENVQYIRSNLGRFKQQYKPSVPVNEILVISQTHTPVFGIELEKHFVELLSISESRSQDKKSIKVLLHPRENSTWLESVGNPLVSISNAPHEELIQPMASSVVLGYMSTAMIEAACCGHYVIGLDWEAKNSQELVYILRPPVVVQTLEQAFVFLDRLQMDEKYRGEFLSKQQTWLRKVAGIGDGESVESVIRLLG